MQAKEFIKAYSENNIFRELPYKILGFLSIALVWLSPFSDVLLNFSTFFNVLSIVGCGLGMLMWIVAFFGFLAIATQDFFAEKDKKLIANFCNFGLRWWLNLLISIVFIFSLIFNGFLLTAIVYTSVYCLGLVVVAIMKTIAVGIVEKLLDEAKLDIK